MNKRKTWVLWIAVSIITAGCASESKLPEQVQPPKEEDVQKIAYKYALLTTKQLTQRREELSRDIAGSPMIAPPAIMLIAAAVRQGKSNEITEIDREIDRRKLSEKPGL